MPSIYEASSGQQCSIMGKKLVL
uniref:Uncharacterized protein n=1 Tax=Anguilla anguilla TaxID=7936 RepID=A0A0E9UN33_ANGAN